MKRKVIQIAESTQLISLPRKWAKAHHIMKGEELEVIEEGSDLIIRAGTEVKPERAVIDVTAASPNLAITYLVAAYRSGYDEVQINYKNPDTAINLQKVANSILLGFEIVNQGERSCTFRDISASVDSEFDNILRRVFFITLALAKNTYEALNQNKFDRLEEGLALEATTNKFSLFCQRLLNKKGKGTYRNTTYLFLTAYQLEKIADHYKYIGEHVKRKKLKKISTDTLELFKEVNEYLKSYHELFYKFDMAKANKLSEIRNQLFSKAQKQFMRSPHKEDDIVHDLLSILQLTYNLFSLQLAAGLRSST